MNRANTEEGACDTSSPVLATLVLEAERLAFLPRHFGRQMMTFETAVYTQMQALSADYTGGYWEFYGLTNGGCFMAPRGLPLRVVAPNGFDETMDAEAAGIVATLHALSLLSFKYQAVETFATRFHELRDFALDHARARAILQAID
jgi:hypothetical protein